MSNILDVQYQPADLAGKLLWKISRLLAVFGGLILCAMALLTTVSVTGRSLSSVSTAFAPIMGDFELVAVGTGVAVFSFLPYCQLVGKNVIVDFFLIRASTRTKAFFDAVGSLAYGIIMVLFSWRSTIGGIDLYKASETTYMLGIPRWWTFPLAVFCLVLLVCVCAYSFKRNLEDFRRGQLAQ